MLHMPDQFPIEPHLLPSCATRFLSLGYVALALMSLSLQVV